MVAQKLGCRSLGELRQSVAKDEMYEWMALAVQQGWWEQSEDEAISEGDPVEAMAQWLTGNSASRS